MSSIGQINIKLIRLQNIVDMGLGFSAMMRLFEEGSKKKLHDRIMDFLIEMEVIDSKEQYEKLHSSFCAWGKNNIYLSEKYRQGRRIKERKLASYGQIAKTLDVVIKVVVHYCQWPYPDGSHKISHWIHAAVDNKMMLMLKKEFSGRMLKWPNSVENVDDAAYGKLQQLVIEFCDSHPMKIMPVEFDDIYWQQLNRG
jgi:hypothetical protein